MVKLRAYLRKRRKALIVSYLLLLGASQAYLAWKGEDLVEGGALQVELDDGVLVYQTWGKPEGIPLLLSHGSPGGGGGDFTEMAQKLAQERWIIAPDRMGFGRSSKLAEDYSFVRDARDMVVLMDELDIPVADVMGWSYGGGVALEMAFRYPERVRSVGLLGAIGIQEGEGSGSYWLEHGKYGMLRALMMWLPEIVPHFGMAGPDWFRRWFVRDFADADQRPLRLILKKLENPTLIVHGKDDPLVPAWVAEEHHELLASSRLVILEGSHFFPVGGKGVGPAVKAVNEFLGKVDGGESVVKEYYETDRKNMKAIWAGGPELRGWKPWWLVILLAGGIGWFKPRCGFFLASLGGGILLWDAMVAILGVFLGLLARKKTGAPIEDARAKWIILDCLVSLVAGSVVGGLLLQVL